MYAIMQPLRIRVRRDFLYGATLPVTFGGEALTPLCRYFALPAGRQLVPRLHVLGGHVCQTAAAWLSLLLPDFLPIQVRQNQSACRN